MNTYGGIVDEIQEQHSEEVLQAERYQQQMDVIAQLDEMSLDEYEIVSPQFFAQIKEPAFTVNVDKVMVNAACVRMMPDVDYVEILVNRKERKVVLRPCTEMDISGYKWARVKDGRRYASQRTGEAFVLTLCQIMNWNPDYRYKILGKKVRAKGQEIMAFDLNAAQCFPKATEDNGTPSRRTSIPVDWDGKFGPTVAENRRTLQVDTFDGYTVFSIKDDRGRGKMPAHPEKQGQDKTQGAQDKDTSVPMPELLDQSPFSQRLY